MSVNSKNLVIHIDWNANEYNVYLADDAVIYIKTVQIHCFLQDMHCKNVYDDYEWEKMFIVKHALWTVVELHIKIKITKFFKCYCSYSMTTRTQ